MGLYDEAAEALRESFTIKDDQIQTYLAGRVQVSDASFLDLLAPERRAAIYQPTSADSAATQNHEGAARLQHRDHCPPRDRRLTSGGSRGGEGFRAGNDSMRGFRQVYAASRLCEMESVSRRRWT
jgi:hypothetical protein